MSIALIVVLFANGSNEEITTGYVTQGYGRTTATPLTQRRSSQNIFIANAIAAVVAQFAGDDWRENGRTSLSLAHMALEKGPKLYSTR